MQAATLLQDFPQPTDEQINQIMSGNLCRCMAYVRIRKAIHLAAGTGQGSAGAPQFYEPGQEEMSNA